MEDVENQGFEAGGSSSQPKEDGVGNKFRTNDESSLNSAQERKSMDNSGSPQRNGNIIAKWNLAFRGHLKKLVNRKSRAFRLVKIVLINAVALGVLIASVINYHNTGAREIDWCNGVGFLWILYCFVYVIVFYQLADKYLGDLVCKFSKPVFRFFADMEISVYCQWVFYWGLIIALALYVLVSPGSSGRRIFSFLGMVVFVILGYLFSKHPAHVNWRPVLCGMVLQFIFGLLTTQLETGRNILDCLGTKVTDFLNYEKNGSYFVFDYLAKPDNEGRVIFAFSVLPVIFFLSFIISILSYFGVLQWVIMGFSRIVRIGMGTTICESVNAAASIFLSMVEAPLLIQEYFKDLTKSELCAIMCAGWSTVAGVTMSAYIQFGVKASHLITASVMSAPASLAYSKLIYPETEESTTKTDNIILHKEDASNFLHAASRGALKGLLLIGSIIANIIAFLGFIGVLDAALSWIGAMVGLEQLSFQFLVTKLFYPVSFLLGVDLDSLEDVAYLIGIKTVANEFQAYQKLGELIKAKKISQRSEIIATYALCGFSNFGSIGITIGVLSVMEPSQAPAVTEVAFTAFVAANMVCFLTACVAGCLIE